MKKVLMTITFVCVMSLSLSTQADMPEGIKAYWDESTLVFERELRNCNKGVYALVAATFIVKIVDQIGFVPSQPENAQELYDAARFFREADPERLHLLGTCSAEEIYL